MFKFKASKLTHFLSWRYGWRMATGWLGCMIGFLSLRIPVFTRSNRKFVGFWRLCLNIPFSPGHIGIGVGKIHGNPNCRTYVAQISLGLVVCSFPRRVEFKTSENHPDTHSLKRRTVYGILRFFSHKTTNHLCVGKYTSPCVMVWLFTYICLINGVNVGKYAIPGDASRILFIL